MANESPFAITERLLSAGQRGRALDELLTAWRAQRAPALGDLVERLSDEDLAAPVRAAKGTAAHLAALEVLTAGPPDPRVATALVGELAKPRFTAQSGKPTWRLVFAQLGDRHADPRTIERLDRLIADYPFIFGATVMAAWMTSQMKKLQASLRERFPSPPAIEDPAFARLAAQLSPSTPSPPAEPVARSRNRQLTEADFWRDIAADPDADDPRLVFADWLLERGDPRGELITLQLRQHGGKGLSLEEQEREREIIAQHATAWLGPLAACTEAWRFERGFLAACRLKGKKFPAEVVDHPLWATVSDLAVGRRGKMSDKTAASIVMAPVLRRLRRLRDVPAVVLEAVAGAAEPWERLGALQGADYEPEYVGGTYGPAAFPPKLWNALIAGRALPALRTLSITPGMHDEGFRAFTDLWTAPLGQRLERVEIRYLRPWDVPRWYADLRDKLRGRNLVIDLGGWIWSPEDGELSRLQIARCGDVSAVVNALQELPADAITALGITLGAPLADRDAARIERAAERFPRLRRLELPRG